MCKKYDGANFVFFIFIYDIKLSNFFFTRKGYSIENTDNNGFTKYSAKNINVGV